METHSSTSQNKYFLIVRHGERLDYVEGPGKSTLVTRDDPGLSKAGFQQAKVTGEYIRDVLKEKGCKKIKIVASPLVRTIQTAVQIALGVGADNVTLDNGFIEWMKHP